MFLLAAGGFLAEFRSMKKTLCKAVQHLEDAKDQLVELNANFENHQNESVRVHDRLEDKDQELDERLRQVEAR